MSMSSQCLPSMASSFELVENVLDDNRGSNRAYIFFMSANSVNDLFRCAITSKIFQTLLSIHNFPLQILMHFLPFSGVSRHRDVPFLLQCLELACHNLCLTS